MLAAQPPWNVTQRIVTVRCRPGYGGFARCAAMVGLDSQARHTATSLCSHCSRARGVTVASRAHHSATVLSVGCTATRTSAMGAMRIQADAPSASTTEICKENGPQGGYRGEMQWGSRAQHRGRAGTRANVAWHSALQAATDCTCSGTVPVSARAELHSYVHTCKTIMYKTRLMRMLRFSYY